MPHNSSSVSLRAAVSNLSQITEEIPDNITSWASAQQAQKKSNATFAQKRWIQTSLQQHMAYPKKKQVIS